LHFLLMEVLQYVPAPVPNRNNDVVTVDLREVPPQRKTKDQQIVRQVQLPKELLTDENDSAHPFLSNERQRVRKEMRAAQNGMTANRSENATNKPQTEELRRKSENPSHQKLQRGQGLQAYQPQLRPILPPPSSEFREQGFSTVGEALPNDMEIGSFTSLNTDRYLYYSFFARIEEQIRFRWESRIRAAIMRLTGQSLRGSNTAWQTNLEIYLKRNGEFDSAHLMKGSGISSFDSAASQAFREARMFPNPPQEMVESDGFIHLRYSFMVRYDPQSVVAHKSYD
jgi:TonB family protein